MLKIFHAIAIFGLLASASYVYSIKYDTLYQAEHVAKLKSRVQRERAAIAVLRAEWQKLDRPERIQALASKGLDLQPMNVTQFVRLADIPLRQPKTDEIGRKLELLGLGLPTQTPDERSKTSDARTPSSSKTPR
jgi:cell division protein FtsL